MAKPLILGKDICTTKSNDSWSILINLVSHPDNYEVNRLISSIRVFIDNSYLLQKEVRSCLLWSLLLRSIYSELAQHLWSQLWRVNMLFTFLLLRIVLWLLLMHLYLFGICPFLDLLNQFTPVYSFSLLLLLNLKFLAFAEFADCLLVSIYWLFFTV